MDNDAAVAPMSGADLRRMRERRDDTQRLLLTIRQKVNRDAEAAVRASHSLPFTHGRHSTSWTRHHEAAFHRNQGTLLSDRRKEIRALEAKLARQNAAITDHHLRSARAGANA